jgi:sterol desaturase/sphingolipid hydroxylase (fatty acid hydroxylase superfamily)
MQEAAVESMLKKSVTYGLYPLMLLGVLGTAHLAILHGWDFKAVYWKTTLVMVAVLMAIERLMPLSRDWSMTGRSFLRDLRYIVMVGPTIGIAKAGFGWLMIRYSEFHTGPLARLPTAVGAIVFLVVFEFFQYHFHRFSHSARGPVGRFLWKAHIAHHLPDRVYVMMHAVFHPVNALISTAIIQVPLLLLGVPPAALLVATLLIDLQSLVSHFNVDIRAGFLNYVFIGTESHRFHHSAAIMEARNFGNTLAIWDLVFGTFFYRPGKAPAKLGLERMEGIPHSESVLSVLALPFRR